MPEADPDCGRGKTQTKNLKIFSLKIVFRSPIFFHFLYVYFIFYFLYFIFYVFLCFNEAVSLRQSSALRS